MTHTPPVSTQQDFTAAPAGTGGPVMESNVLVRVICPVYDLPSYWARKMFKLNVAV